MKQMIPGKSPVRMHVFVSMLVCVHVRVYVHVCMFVYVCDYGENLSTDFMKLSFKRTLS